MCPRCLLAVAHRIASKPRFAPLDLLVLDFGISIRTFLLIAIIIPAYAFLEDIFKRLKSQALSQICGQIKNIYIKCYPKVLQLQGSHRY